MDHMATDRVTTLNGTTRDLAYEVFVLEWRISCNRALPERHRRRVVRLEQLRPRLRRYLDALGKLNGRPPKFKPVDLVGPSHPAVSRASR